MDQDFINSLTVYSNQLSTGFTGVCPPSVKEIFEIIVRDGSYGGRGSLLEACLYVGKSHGSEKEYRRAYYEFLEALSKLTAVPVSEVALKIHNWDTIPYKGHGSCSDCLWDGDPEGCNVDRDSKQCLLNRKPKFL